MSIIGSSRHTVLRGSLCVHHIWRLWSLLRRRLHTHSSSYYHSCGNTSFYYWTYWVLCHNSRKSLWTCYSKLRMMVFECCVSVPFLFNWFRKIQFLKFFLSCFIVLNVGLVFCSDHLLSFFFFVLNDGVEFADSGSRRLKFNLLEQWTS